MLSSLPFTFAALRAAYDEGLRPEDLVAEIYRRIAAAEDPAIFLHLRPQDDVLAEAAALGARTEQTLWGLPFAIKDNMDLAGAPTTAACPAFAYDASVDGFALARLRAAGALVIGKTNLDQFATGLVGVRSPYGVPKNALDPEIVPGGSSSGSAVAVARGLVSFSLGTDTAGSGRVPAALNGIVGLKPSLGALSAEGLVPACRSLDTISVFASNSRDAYEVFQTACAFDPLDPYSADLPAPDLSPPPPALKIGVPAPESLEFFGDHAQAEMFAQALDQLSQAGHQITPIDFTPFYETAQMLYEGAWVAERYTVVEDLMTRDPGALYPATAQVIGAAQELSAADAFRGIYRLKALRRQAEAAMDGLDLLCVPSIPCFYTLADLEADPITPNSNLGTYTNFVNLLDLCGMAVPTAPRRDGRPGSVTLLARAGQDALTASLAAVLESDTPIPAAQKSAPEDAFVIAVCGAHMSGLPLNSELTSRGGRFLQAVKTAPQYRFYALKGGPPYRPGLLRHAQGETGAAIQMELWALPKSAFGSFMAGIPAPLCIGTIALENGQSAQGFLVEPAGLDGAEDITALGGWRAYLARQSQGTAP